ncbi:hypothetical protein QWY82_13390 [Simiduia curdlanivorans]|uniref:Protein YgfX n=1 Tax=Simiduia curdlanivorans TaxID=1492769 RepID=A0ABV8V9Z7_9GAMM|nr:protein YgfX [Simiduia curdlanivorans]MDN3639793.1 hypothetical protein [Simiduia curdlanivorans]
MSKSFATIQGSNLAELSAISLAPARQEQYYKGSLLGLVLLPTFLLFFPYIEFWFGGSGYHLLATFSVRSIALLIALGCFILALFAYLVYLSVSPLNRGITDQYLRKNDVGWWLGAGSQWRPVTLTGEALISFWLIVLKVRCQGSSRSRYVWLWQDAVGAGTHRKLRLLLRQ